MKTITNAPLFICLLLGFFILQGFQLRAGSVERIKITGPLGFIENKGQFRDQNKNVRTDLLYMYVHDGLKVQLLSNTVSFELYTLENDPASVSEADGFLKDHSLDPEDRPIPAILYKSNRIDIEFIGANKNPQIIAEEMLADYLNYYLSFTPQDGITEVRQYNKITYKNLYNNIDLVMIAKPDQSLDRMVAYDFVVHPGGNVNDIRYRYRGSDQQLIYANGTMETGSARGRLFEIITESYSQTKDGIKLKPVSATFRNNDGVVSFSVNHFDKKQTLVIDPALTWATYAGGTLDEEGRGVAVDSSDNVILIGRTYSTDGIATAGAYQTELLGDVDMQIEKYTASCARIWGTYYGGSAADHIRGIITGVQDTLYFGAHTDSPDGCATAGAYRENFAGGEGDDGLLACFTPSGFRHWATYYGGTGTDIMRRLDFDHNDDIIMVGYSESDTGIATPGTWQTEWHGHSDLCLSKWSRNGQLIWGTYHGGESEDHGRSVKTDDNGNIYVNGSTGSQFGIAKNAYKDYDSGGQDYLLAKFNPEGGLKWSTYWGGAVEDRGRGVYVNPTGDFVYFTGYSASDTGVALPGAFQTQWSEGYDNQSQPFHDMVLMKWSKDGYPIWSTYCGGPLDDRGRAITMIDEDVYVGGTTSNSTVMSTPDVFQPVFGGNDDMFLEKFDKNGNRIWGTYIGGAGSESTLALAVDREKLHVYQVGTATSTDIATPDAAQPVFAGYEDCYLAKIQVDSVVGINSPSSENAMTIYPDPNMGDFSVKYHVSQPAMLVIYDVKGIVIYNKVLTAGSMELKINDLKPLPGIYTCSITENGKEVSSLRFIVLK